MNFRPAKHCRWIIKIFQIYNALSLTRHNRLHLDPHDLEILKNFPKDSGLILAVNHSDEMDPRACAELSRRSHLRFTYMINSEAFEKWHGLYGWLLQRLGGFSIERSGDDQAAMRYAIEIVKKEAGALVMFPEGEVSYLNDLVQPFKTGAVHIGLQAIIETRKTNPAWTAYILPAAIKYYYRKPIGLILDKRIRALEKHLSLRAGFFTLQEKIIRIMAKILKCPEIISRTRIIPEQLEQLKEQVDLTRAALLAEAQEKYPQLQVNPKASLVDRAQKIIFFLREQLTGKKLFNPKTKTQLQNDIKDLKRSIQMSAWQPQYISITPSEERLAETVMKLERETFKLKAPRPLGNRNIFVRIGAPLGLRRYVELYQKDPSILAHKISEQLRDTIQLLIQKMTIE